MLISMWIAPDESKMDIKKGIERTLVVLGCVEKKKKKLNIL